MEFIQKKTSDSAVEYFLPKAADREISLPWDRYEGQLPECGFCESGLSCRDCLQGPCISHPFRDQSKQGICGKDRDLLAAQTLLRLVIKGTMSALDQLSDFVAAVEDGQAKPKEKAKANQILQDIQALLANGNAKVMKEFPKTLTDTWKELGIRPEGVARDLFKTAQKLEGGVSGYEETLLWAFKAALLGCVVQKLQGKLKDAVFGTAAPAGVDVNMGALKEGTPTILLYGSLSPVLKYKIAEAAKKGKVSVLGVCTDPLVSPYQFAPVTSYGSQEIPLMTGAVDLIVAGDQGVNPALVKVAEDWKVTIVPAQALHAEQDLGAFARDIVEKAREAFDIRGDIVRDIPVDKESAVLGFSPEGLGVKKIAAALAGKKIKGLVIFAGSNNVKYTQDGELVEMAKEFLQNDILCISEGEASVVLAKYGFLNPKRPRTDCGKGLSGLIASLGKNVPAVIDCNAMDMVLAVAAAAKKDLKNLPVIACFPEANRSLDVVKALGMVALGVSTYFWPNLPVTGSPNVVQALSEMCSENFGARLHVVTKKMAPSTKASLFLKDLTKPASMSGKVWK